MSEVQQAVKDLQEQIQKNWHDFKKVNDEQIAKLEKGVNDRVGQDQLEKLNAVIGDLQKQVTELDKKGGRRGTTADEEEQKQQRKAFDEYVRQGIVGPNLRKAMETGNGPKGGYLVPDEMDRDIVQYERDNAPMRQLCSVRTVGSEKFERPVNQGGTTSGWVGELEARVETSTPAIAMLEPSFGTVYAEPHVTQNMLDDAFLNMEAFLAEEVGKQFAEDENAAFMTGNGVKKPMGLLTSLSTSEDGSRAFGTIQKIISGVAGEVTADKLIDLVHKVKRGYRKNFMMTNLTLAAIRKLKDDNLHYLWEPSMQAGAPSLLLGYPVEENDDMTDPAADANAVVFGDLKRAYEIFDIKGVRTIRDEITTKGMVKFYTWKRVGGGVVNDRAVKVLTLSAS